ncbi:MAG: DUF4915 domain-containing protein [Alphaproteobacteria bacterium]|nr:DUF4915 domain-containing protein [Alphaproteobacteria bacterium]
MNEADTTGPGRDAPFEMNASRGFEDWFGQLDVSLAVTTYQVGKLFLLGIKPDGKLWIFNRNIGRCLGLAVAGGGLWVTGDNQIFRLENALEDNAETTEGHDAVYVPQTAHYTGDLDIHDLAVEADGRLVFVNTLFNCLATVSSTHSFIPLWRPGFISRLAAEDRCHLNGLALVEGKAAYVTAVSESDTFDGWHDGKLWLLNSGTGEFGYLDAKSGAFEAVCFCPGYLRGLSFVGNYAVMGLSLPRGNKTFSGLALEARLEERKIEPRCGLYFVDLATGDVAHSITIEGVVSELYDVAVIPGRKFPIAYGPMSPELARLVSVGELPN